MPRVRKTRGGRTRIRGIGSFTAGDTASVSEEDAAYLCTERGDFERIDDGVTDVEHRDVDDTTDEGDGGEMEYEERRALAEGLSNEHWSTAVSTIEDGEADAYLDELADVDDRSSVQDAITDRQSALEEE